MPFEIFDFDFVVVGSGLAGLNAAVKASEYGRVAVVTKGKLNESSSFNAQGGIAVAIGEKDNPKNHIKDTLMAGRGLCDPEAVKMLVVQGREAVNALIREGLTFDNRDGKLLFSLEGGHSTNRVIHLNGANTGKYITLYFAERVNNNPRIKIFENTFATGLLKQNGKVIGLKALNLLDEQNIAFYSPVVILASGGYSRIYERSTNPDTSTGDGVWLAAEAGTEIRDIEFIQFHPTAFYDGTKFTFLISEAVRGEGGLLLNSNLERFMPRYDEMNELAPRDIVAKAILSEMKKTRKDFVYLDLRHLNAKLFKEKFSNIANFLNTASIDFTKDLIPVAPAAHYTMGGIKTDLDGATNIPGLFACGECASTGVHGANRLASNSLLECLVFSERAVEKAKNLIGSKIEKCEKDLSPVFTSSTMHDAYETLKIKVAELLTKSANILRKGENLKEALKEVKELKVGTTLDEYYSIKARSLKKLASMILKAAELREESRGAHQRDDFKQTRAEFEGHFTFKENEIYFERKNEQESRLLN